MAGHFRILLTGIAIIAALTGCKEKKLSRFELLSPDATHISFSNTLAPTDTFNVLQYVYFFNGGGVAVGDINNDGLKDVFFSGNQVSSKLYVNEGNFSFKDITESSGVTTDRWSTGVSMADVNNDGWLDIYVCVAGHPDSTRRGNLLFINNKDQTFTESAAQYGLTDNGYSTQAAFFDYDKDGDNDMYLLRHDHQVRSLNDPKVKSIHGEAKSTDRLFRNNGNHTFTDVSGEAGITIEGYGLGIGISDINNDGWPDIYVSNDFIFNDLMYINQKDGTFKNEIKERIQSQSFNGMGNDVADINNDGLVDILVADMLPEDNGRLKAMMMPYTYDKFRIGLMMGYEPQYMRNTLQLNNGNGSFSEIGQLAGVYNTDWSWGPLLADFDNDGNKDLFMANGYLKDMTDLDFIVYRKRNMMFKKGDDAEKALLEAINKLWGAKVNNYMFRNEGDLTFSNHSQDWGFTQSSFSNGAAYADLDNDGDLDIVVNNINEKAFVYRNTTADAKSLNHFLQISLKGPDGNRAGYGAKIFVKTAGKAQFIEQSPFRGFQSTVDDVIHFGLGDVTTADELTVQWPDGKMQHFTQVKGDQRLVVDHAEATNAAPSTNEVAELATFTDDVIDGLDFVHKETEYEDFGLQPILPHKSSQHGPKLAVADVNNDGLEDIYIGGSKGYSGKLFLQNKSGKFQGVIIEASTQYEDQSALFFDADGDGDQDLYVVSGGSESVYPGKDYQDRLYRNNGKGVFTLDASALPVESESGSCVVAADLDKDGDLDIFVGGGVVPGQYPDVPRSMVLRNDKGTFSDVTATINKKLSTVGLVTAAVWADVDNDTWPDLVVAGEWMPITIFKNQQGKLNDVTSDAGLASYLGWWTSLAAADIDNDGDVDLVAGNVGLNNKFKGSDKEPVTLYAKDFNKDNVVDPVIFTYVQGKQRPVATRDDLADQIPFIRDKLPMYKKYGEATVNEIFSPEELADARVLKANHLATSYLENKGGGKFVVHVLPAQAQLSPVNGIVIDDFNEDGAADILLAGNSYGYHVLTGRLDASYGTLLQGNGKGAFTVTPYLKSGFFVKGPVMDLRLLNTKNFPVIVAGINSDSVRTFRYSKTKK